ncbi:hypothetical protein [uncultured Clostridium sp.]|uniref:hypothetical protein n=1 Tax=uncultured Clostridium sp. TaxID=59620 RepID=UPI0027DAED2C|nr:hypothetical protein [uncultured Clostridium sp.]
MATKLNNNHLSIILENCKKYKILDIYISLAYVSLETKDGQYVIQTYSGNLADLIEIVRINVHCSYKTAYNCLTELINLNILSYSSDLCGWTMLGMESMVKSKLDFPEDNSLYGYTTIRNFFITDEFYNMKAREKRLIIYLCQLSDSKKSNFYSDFSVNLLKPNSSWLKILKTKSVYYARTTLENLLKKYENLFLDKSDDFRSKQFAPKRVNKFKFLFSSDLLKNNTDDLFNILKKNNTKEYNLIIDKIKFSGITLPKQKIMHLIRGIVGIRYWFIKERVVQIIINKYIAIQIHNSREDIKSLPAYVAAVVKSIINEFKIFEKNHKQYSKSRIVMEYQNQDINEDNYKQSVLKLISQFN